MRVMFNSNCGVLGRAVRFASAKQSASRTNCGTAQCSRWTAAKSRSNHRAYESNGESPRWRSGFQPTRTNCKATSRAADPEIIRFYSVVNQVVGSSELTKGGSHDQEENYIHFCKSWNSTHIRAIHGGLIFNRSGKPGDNPRQYSS